MKKKLVTGLLFGVLMVSIIGCGSTHNAKSNAGKQKNTVSVNKLSKEQVIQDIKKNFSDSKFKYKEINYDNKKNTLEVKLSIDGLTESLSMTKRYDMAQGKEDWGSIKDSYNKLCLRIRNQFKENGYDDVDVFLFLVNDLNTDNALFSSLNGVEYSDYMK